MHIETFVLCDYAADNQGKLSAMGLFDSVNLPTFPAALPHCALAIRLRFESSEAGAHHIRVVMIDEDGRDAGLKLNINANVSVPQGVPSFAMNFPIGLLNTQFAKPGTYHIDLIVEGWLKARLPLFVRNAGQIRQVA